MKKLLLGLTVLMMAVSRVSADTRTVTERECTTDSYGNTTCRDKTTNIETGVITYSNESVTVSGTNAYIDGSVIGTGTVVGTTTTTGSQVQILNTSVPSSVSAAAGVVVLLGAVSWGLKLALHRR